MRPRSGEGLSLVTRGLGAGVVAAFSETCSSPCPECTPAVSRGPPSAQLTLGGAAGASCEEPVTRSVSRDAVCGFLLVREETGWAESWPVCLFVFFCPQTGEQSQCEAKVPQAAVTRPIFLSICIPLPPGLGEASVTLEMSTERSHRRSFPKSPHRHLLDGLRTSFARSDLFLIDYLWWGFLRSPGQLPTALAFPADGQQVLEELLGFSK